MSKDNFLIQMMGYLLLKEVDQFERDGMDLLGISKTAWNNRKNGVTQISTGEKVLLRQLWAKTQKNRKYNHNPAQTEIFD